MRKILTFGAKFSAFFFAGITATAVVGFLILHQLEIPQTFIQKIAAQEIRKITGFKVHIGSISGSLITNIQFNNVQMVDADGNDLGLSVDHIIFKLNPFRLLQSHGDFLSIIRDIRIEDGDIRFARRLGNPLDQFRTARSEAKSGTISAFQLPLSTTLSLENVKIYFADYKGWYDKPLDQPFKELFLIQNGVIKLRPSYFETEINGQIGSSQKPFQIDGSFGFSNKTRALTFHLEPEFSHWATYILWDSPVKLSGDAVEINGKIENKPSGLPKGKLPFWMDITLKPHNGTLDLPWIKGSIQQLNGTVQLLNGKILPRSFSTMTMDPILSMKIWRWLFEHQLIDEQGNIVMTEANFTAIQNETWPNSFRKYQPQILTSLIRSPIFLGIQELNGNWFKEPIEVDGVIDLLYRNMAVNIKTKAPFKADFTKHFTQALERIPIQGEITSQMTLFGPYSNLIGQGRASLKKAQILSVPIETEAEFRIEGSQINITLPKGTAAGGKITGKITVNWEKEVDIKGQLFGTNWDVGQITTQNSMLGKFDIATTFEGPLDAVSIQTHVTGNELSIFRQNILSLDSSLQLHNQEDLYLDQFLLTLNQLGSVLSGTGTITNWEKAELALNGENIQVSDPDPYSSFESAGLLSFQGQLNTRFSTQFWADPFSQLNASANAQVRVFPFFGHFFESGTANIQIQDGKIHLNNVSLINTQSAGNREQLSIQGTLDRNAPINLSVKSQNLDLTRSALVKRLIPVALQPLTGQLFSEFNMQKRSDAAPEETGISSYLIYGHALLKNARLRNQPFDSIELDGEWNGKLGNIKALDFKKSQSQLQISGQIQANHEMKLLIQNPGKINLDELGIILAPYGQFSGEVSLAGSISGTLENPTIQIQFLGDDLKTNYLATNHAEAQLLIKDKILQVQKFSWQKKKGQYDLQGQINLSPLLKTDGAKASELDYEFSLKVSNADFTSISELGENIIQEIRRNMGVRPALSPEKVKASNVTMSMGPEPQYSAFRIAPRWRATDTLPLYKLSSGDTVLGLFSEVFTNEQDIEAPAEIGIKQWTTGEVSGAFTVKSTPQKPVEISSDLAFKNLRVAMLDSKTGTLSIKPSKKDLVIQLNLENGQFAQKPFEKIDADLIYRTKSGYLESENLVFKTLKFEENVVKGQFPLSSFWNKDDANNPMQLNILLKGDQIGLLSMLNPKIQTIKNEGEIELAMGGTLAAPLITAKKINLQNASIQFEKGFTIESPIQISATNPTLVNNLFTIPAVRLSWQGSDTKLDNEKPFLNKVDLSGVLKLKDLNFVSPNISLLDMTVKVKPTTLHMVVPDLFSGKATLSDIQINGPYLIPMTQKASNDLLKKVMTPDENGPVISGKAYISDSKILIPKIGSGSINPSFKLNLNTYLNHNVSVTGGLLGKGFLEGIANEFSIDLEKSATPLDIQGTLNAPIINNQVKVLDGKVNFLNRNFKVLQPRAQTQFSNSQFNAEFNTIRFTSQKIPGTQELMLFPVMNIKAYTVIKGSTNADSSLTNPKVVVININGPLNQLNELIFDEYEVDSTNESSWHPKFSKSYILSSKGTEQFSNSEISQDTTEVLKLLMPEIFTQGVISETMINQLGENTINQIVESGIFKPIEHNIEKVTGLYDVRIDYNAGSAILGGISNNPDTIDSNLGISIVKDFLDERLFLRLKTDVSLNQDSATNASGLQGSELEWTYYFKQNLSLGFSQINEDSDTIKSKMTLKLSHEY